MIDQASGQHQIQEYTSQLSDVAELLLLTPDDESLLVLKSDLLELLTITQQQLGQQTTVSVTNESIQQQQLSSSTTIVTTSGDFFQKALEAAVETSVGLVNAQQQQQRHVEESKKRPNGSTNSLNDDGEGSFVNVVTEASIAAANAMTSSAMTESSEATEKDLRVEASAESSKKKSKLVTSGKVNKEFEVPPHLIPNEGDSESDKNKKRRTIKALKSKWREKQKEMESEKKQQSWQSFQKKKSNSTSANKERGSIFSTADIGNSKVGVVATTSTTPSNSNQSSTFLSVSTAASGRQMTGFSERKRHK
jgi:hypothetical protein